MHGKRIDTCDRIIIFNTMEKHIPSYVYVRGWRAFVRYHGQPQTYRVCGLTGHFAMDCPRVKKTTENTDNKDTPMETQSTEPQITPVEIIDTPRESAQDSADSPHISKPNPKELKSYLDDVIGSVSTDNEDDIQSITSTEEGQNIISFQQSSAKEDLISSYTSLGGRQRRGRKTGWDQAMLSSLQY